MLSAIKFGPAGVVNHSVYWRDSGGSNQKQLADTTRRFFFVGLGLRVFRCTRSIAPDTFSVAPCSWGAPQEPPHSFITALSASYKVAFYFLRNFSPSSSGRRSASVPDGPSKVNLWPFSDV